MIGDPERYMIAALADRLGKTLQEIRDMPVEDFEDFWTYYRLEAKKKS